MIKNNNNVMQWKNYTQLVRQGVKGGLSLSILLFSILTFTQPAKALVIDFDYTYDTYNFFTPERKAVLKEAAKYYESFTDKLTAIDPFGSNHWLLNITHPSNKTEIIQLENLYIPQDTIKVYVGSDLLAKDVLASTTNGQYRITGYDYFKDIVKHRGQGDTIGATANDYAMWGGVVSFNNSVGINWGSSLEDLTLSENDLYSVAVHELAHIFGIGIADSWFNQTTFNQYGMPVFVGEKATMVYGRDVPITFDKYHWQDGTGIFVEGEYQEAAFDPTLLTGTAKPLTLLDQSALQDLGWEVVYAPVPSALGFYLAGLAALLIKKYRRH